MISQCIICLCIVQIVYVMLLAVVYELTNVSEIRPFANKNHLTLNPYPIKLGTPTQIMKRDCDTETVYSMLDSQCEHICQGINNFFSHNGTCVRRFINSQNTTTVHCDPRKGTLAIKVGDTQFGVVKTRCMSIDPGIQSDSSVEGQNKLCQGGDIQIDYSKKFPSIHECTCKTGQIKIVIPNTGNIRHRAVCVNIALIDLFEESGLVYDDSKIYR